MKPPPVKYYFLYYHYFNGRDKFNGLKDTVDLENKFIRISGFMANQGSVDSTSSKSPTSSRLSPLLFPLAQPTRHHPSSGSLSHSPSFLQALPSPPPVHLPHTSLPFSLTTNLTMSLQLKSFTGSHWLQNNIQPPPHGSRPCLIRALLSPALVPLYASYSPPQLLLPLSLHQPFTHKKQPL